MLADLASQPWRVARHARVLARLHDQLHQIAAPAGLRRPFGSGDRIVHLDLHPGNVMLTPDGPVVIDWTNAAAGPTGADVAIACLIMASSDVDDLPPWLGRRSAGCAGSSCAGSGRPCATIPDPTWPRWPSSGSPTPTCGPPRPPGYAAWQHCLTRQAGPDHRSTRARGTVAHSGQMEKACRQGHDRDATPSGRRPLSSAVMPRLLVVHHTPSPALQAMFEAAVSGARTDEITGVEVMIRPALTAAAADVLQADGYLLGTPANIGYMSGALKHFFDGIYYPCLEATRRRPYGLYVHGGSDTGGAVRAVESIATGLQWRPVRPPVTVTGPPGKADLDACWELGALLAAELAG